MKRNYIVIQTQVYLLLPLLILLFPDIWVLSWILAALIHECFHLLAMWLLKVKILKIEIGVFGAIIETESMDHYKELIVALAGPVGALLTLLFSKYIPRIALCAIVQTVYNLLPVYPLDGGRAVRCLLISKMKSQHLVFLEKGVLYAIVSTCVFISIAFKLGILPLILGTSLLIKHRNANIPCKQWPYRVQ